MKLEQRPRQQEFEFKSWGGARPGAGRKPRGARSRVSHVARAKLATRFPVHVTCRLERGLPSLRRKQVYRTVAAALGAGRDRLGFRLNHYSVQSNHLHLIVEAKDRQALSRGMQGLSIRLAKALNREWKRSGRIFADRYHDRILRTPREVRNALVYVLNNCRKHGIWPEGPDSMTSAPWFDGWKNVTVTGAGAPLVARARSWLLDVGWRRHGLLCWTEIPRGPS